MKGVFVIGTDTGVGKTAVCAGLLKMTQGQKKGTSWKPVQTGTIRGDDTSEVKMLSNLQASSFIEPAFRFPEPLSPYKAAEKWGKKISLSELSSLLKKEIEQEKFVIVEGAGGLLVPYDREWLQIDLIKASEFPVLIVGKDKVGVINQVLLTLAALKDENIAVLGVVLTHSTGNSGNAEVITEFSKTKVILELLPKEDKRLLVAEVERCEELRRFMGVPVLTV